MNWSCNRWVLICLLASPALSQAHGAELGAPVPLLKVTLPAGVRVGAWLTENYPHLTGSMYWPGLMWTTKSALIVQEEEKAHLLQALQSPSPRSPESLTHWGELSRLLESMPVTGRKPLWIQDPWLMQAHPGYEPVSEMGDEVIAASRPDHIRVITAQSQPCDVQVKSQRFAADYVRACGEMNPTGMVWLIQPDGVIRQLKTGFWNIENQPAPAPGAWLWVAPQDMPMKLSLSIAQLLSTQGAAYPQSPIKVLRLPDEPSSLPQNLPWVLNDWGVTGLMQTPSARSASAGVASLTVNRVWPYTHTTLTLSPFDSVEMGFRYTNITNRLYGPEIAGNQGYKDKSTEIKWRMMPESAQFPALALGFRDPIGTGLFAGEYLVASKRWQNWDWSLGLGWGYLGSRGNLANPLNILGSRFSTRQQSPIGAGGTAQAAPLFTGPTALFGGVQWTTPLPHWVLKAELDGNAYRHEPLGNEWGGAKSPFNFGVTWSEGPWSVSLGYERGQQWMLGFTLSTDLSKLRRGKNSEPQAWSVPTAASTQPLPVAFSSSSGLESLISPGNGTDHEIASLGDFELTNALFEQTGWIVHSLRKQRNTWRIEFENAQGFSLPERLDRAMRVVNAMAPGEVQSVQFILLQQGVPVISRSVDRASWLAPRQAWTGQQPNFISTPLESAAEENLQPSRRKLSANVGLSYQQQIGGPDGYLYALNGAARIERPLWSGAWFQAAVNARLVDNFAHFHYTAPSNLPRVRTWVREYLTSQRITMPLAQVNQLNRWGEGLYSLVYAGALESMFAGVGGELLWRPLGQPWALGADINHLAQRDFDQRFKLLDYRVNSGHLSAYWDTGWQNVEAKVMVGQYLAGDRGLTFEVAHRFDNGARMGAWITKTNVSSSAFGEGSFDKGVFVSIPFDAFLSAWSTQTASAVWQPLIRDGGARLNKSQNLWNLTRTRDEREWFTERDGAKQ